MIKKELLDELLKDCESPEKMVGKDGVLGQLSKAIYERALETEMSAHLGYERHDRAGDNTGNSRNGTNRKSVKGAFGEVELEVPRDRNGTFEPQLVKKGQRRLGHFDEKILALYARGMSTREIRAHLEEAYGVEVSPALVSKVTDAVLDEVKAWQSRPLDGLYPIVYLDAIHVKARQDGRVVKQAIYLALGINLEGHKELLGLWIGQTEGAKFWLNVLTELKNRGLQDVLIACVDGLTGFPEAIESVYPQTDVQLCIVHLVRNSLRFVSWKQRKEVAADLRTIYAAPTVEAAEQALSAFAEKWDGAFPNISRSWRSRWEQVVPFFDFPAEIRKVVYTTNAIESVNAGLRKVLKHRGAFPTQDALRKVVYLALQNLSKKWRMPIRDWNAALNQLAIKYGERVPV